MRGRPQRARASAVKPTGSVEEQDVWPSCRILGLCYLPPICTRCKQASTSSTNKTAGSEGSSSAATILLA